MENTMSKSQQLADNVMIDKVIPALEEIEFDNRAQAAETLGLFKQLVQSLTVETITGE